MTKEIFLVIKYFSRKTCLFVDSLWHIWSYLLFVVVGVLACYFDTSPEAMNYIVPTGRRAWKMLNHNFMLVKTLLHATIVFAPYDFFSPSKVMFVFLLFFLLRIMIYYDCEKPSCPWSKCTTCERNEHSWQVDSRTFHATALLRRSICRDQCGYRRYLYCKGNEQTTSRLG